MRDLVQDNFEIIELPESEVISEPGFYRISLERHHNQPCDGPSVTSGVLRKMELESPADVWAFHRLNPNRWESKQTDALRLGRAMACFVEGGPELLEEEFRALPENKPKRPTPAQMKAYNEGRGTEAGIRSVEFWANVEADSRDIITEAEWEQLCNMGKVLVADPAASAVMDGVPEVSMAWKDERTGIWCLARPDTVSFSGLVTDYKKMATRGTSFNERLVDHRITQHGYDMQGAFACEGFKQLTDHWPSFGIIAQWDSPPHHVILREISDEDLRIGAFRNNRALTRVRECLDSGIWPGPGETTGVYRRPDWQREMLLEEMQIEGKAP
ncbi:hypothetical protein NBRC116590_03080 [Pelagimonas sp. KU-00592-HH]|uniref:PD-(D/E)XK nuclease-like domain-containing protein n=1 Tax=Pelagimonas sp. KU-00592-HH TaxID=3127651 RepID=UPI003103FA2C